jgi:serine/threonine-protein kinase
MSLPSDDALLGRVIAGKFCLRSVIGVGAAGSVYKADQTSLGRTVAVKVLRPEIACDPRFIRRFHDEAQAASRLNHPNVVSVIDFGQTDDGLLYLVMEYLRGVTLTDVMRSEQLSTERIADIIRQILSALEEAHEGGVVHADLKSDNTMVEHRRGGWDLVKVVDFGIARLTGDADEQNEDTDDTICGTPEYMAPEVIRGQDPTPASDIYAVGIMLYELLVGYTPFSGVATLEVLQRHLKEEPLPPSERNPATPVPAYLEEAVLRALQKDPSDRFANAGAFADALVPPASARKQSLEDAPCVECGVVSPGTFKFCPECGHAMPAPGKEFELDLDDTGYDEIWSDDAKTADLEARDLGEIAQAAKRRPPRAPTQDVRELLAQDTQRELFPLPLLGRDRELAILEDFVGSDEMGAVHIRGERGSGRTRLLFDACQRAVGEDGVVFLAQSDPSQQATSFYPIRAIVAAILQLPPDATYEDIGEIIEDLGLSERDLPGIGELFQHEGAGLWQLESEVRRREVFASTMRLLRAAGRMFSAVLAFEDCHLYDQPSRDLVLKLCESNQRSPSLRIIVTSDEGEGFQPEGVTQIDLLPLVEDDHRSIISHFASRGHPDLVTLNELQTCTQGNPGHLEQLLRYAAEDGDLQYCPEGLADLVTARIDFLPQVAKRVLQAAAVFGLATAEEDLVQALASSVGRIEMDAALKLLSTRSLLRREAGMLHFDVTMVREVSYEATPLDVRRGLHLAAGDILLANVSDPAVLGFHAERAGDMGRAAELLSRAGDNAIKQLDEVGAAALLNRALNATRCVLQSEQDLQAQVRLVEISIKLAGALRAVGEIGLARGILNESKDQCMDTPPLRVRLLRASARLHAAEGDIQGAIDLCRQAVGIAIPIFAVELLTETYLDLATMMLRNGQSAEAAVELEESIDLITMGEGPSTTSAPTQFWRLLLRLGQLLSSEGQSMKALRMVEHAARLAESNKSSLGVARANITLASILESIGDSSKAQSYRQRAIDDMRTLGDRRATAELLLAGGRPSQTVGRITPASVREARMLAEEVGWDEGVRQARRASHEG